MDLGTLALTITADANSLDATLGSAAKGVENFVNRAEGFLLGLGENLAKSFASIGANPFGAAVIGAQMLKSAVGDLAGELATLAKEGEKWSAQQGSLARRMGVTADVAAGLQLQARQLGMEVSQLRTLFGTFSMRLGQAAAGSTEMTRALAEIGLSAKDLQALSPDQALQRIGAALQGVSEQGHRAQLTMSILGRRGLELEPILSGGAIWGASAQQQARAWGLVVDEATQKTIKAAVVARAVADSALFSIRQSIANSVAAAVAPAKQFIAEMTIAFVNFAQAPIQLVREAIGTVGGWIKAVIDGIREGLATHAPILKDIQATWLRIWGALKAAFASAMDGKTSIAEIAKFLTGSVLLSIKIIVSQVEVWMGALSGVVWMAMRLVDSFAMIAQLVTVSSFWTGSIFAGSAANEVAAVGMYQGLAKVVEQIKVASTEAREFEVELQKVVAALQLQNFALNAGIGDAEARLLQLAAQERRALEAFITTFGSGLFNQEILQAFDAGIAQELESLHNAQHLNDLLKDRQKILDGLLTPLNKFEDQVASIQEMMVRGWFGAEGGINFEQGVQALGAAFEQLDRAQQRRGVQLAGGLQSGSAAAISLINQSSVQQNNDPAERLRQIAAESLATQLRQEALGRQVLAATQQIANQPEPEVFDGN